MFSPKPATQLRLEAKPPRHANDHMISSLPLAVGQSGLTEKTALVFGLVFLVLLFSAILAWVATLLKKTSPDVEADDAAQPQ